MTNARNTELLRFGLDTVVYNNQMNKIEISNATMLHTMYATYYINFNVVYPVEPGISVLP